MGDYILEYFTSQSLKRADLFWVVMMSMYEYASSVLMMIGLVCCWGMLINVKERESQLADAEKDAYQAANENEKHFDTEN